MATVNLGRVKPVNKGTWSSATTYAIDDFVQYTDSGVLSTYIAVAASSNQTPSTSGTENGTYWKYMSKGTNIAVGNNKIIATDGSGNPVGVTMGTAGQAVKVNAAANGFEFGGVGTYSVHAHDEYSYTGTTTPTTTADYFDIAGGNTVSFTPTHVNDLVFFRHQCQMYFVENANGADAYLMMSTNSTIGASDTKLNYNGQHSVYFSQESSHHETLNKTWILKCTGLSVGTTYYVEQAAGKHNNLSVSFNHGNSGGTSSMKHGVQLIHYKYNA